MSNRQARREQQRQARAGRTRPAQQRRPSASPGGGGGPGDFISRPFLLIAGALVIGLIAVIVAVVVFTDEGDPELVEALNEARQEFPSDLATGYELGSDDAPLVITQYEDFRCPHCLDYTAKNEPGIINEYVLSGQVKLEFKHFAVLGPDSVNASVAAECAQQQDKFWDYHFELFINQAEGEEFSEGALRDMAGNIGLDMEQYDACYASDDTRELVSDHTLEARSFGLTGTPGFLFNGVPVQAGAPANMEGWRTIIDAELDSIANATPTAEGSATAEGSPSPEATPTVAQ